MGRERRILTVQGSITAIAGAIAILAAVRVVQLAVRLDDERARKLARALVVHGAAVFAFGAGVVLSGGLEWAAEMVVALATAGWGSAWILIGRAYDPDEPPEQRERRFEALRREERLARPTAPAADPVRRPADEPAVPPLTRPGSRH